MAYSKTTWVNGTAPAINATNLNKIEQGIENALKVYTTTGTSPNYLLTVSGVTSLGDLTNYPIYVNFHSAASGASTININSYGSKSLKAFSGTSESDPTLAAGSMYIIIYNGTQFIVVGLGSGVSTSTASRAAIFDGSNQLTSSNVTMTELSYVSGVTSGIQGQLNSKLNAMTLTASRAIVSDGSGNITVSASTAAQIGFLSDVTSAIQAQLNAKSSSRKIQSTQPTGVAGDVWYKVA